MSELSSETRELLQRADDSLRAAQSLLDGGFPDFAASRAYYAAFYAVSALLLRNGRQFKRHSAVLVTFQRDYVKPGTVSAELGRAFQALSQLRYLGDYGGPAHVGPDQAQDAIASARSLVAAVMNLLRTPSTEI